MKNTLFLRSLIFLPGSKIPSELRRTYFERGMKAQAYAERYPLLKLVNIQDFGGWEAAQSTYFADGGMFDRVFTPGK